MNYAENIADPMWIAKRHKWFPSLCSLPTGELISADIAIARGYTFAEEPASEAPKPPPPAKPTASPSRPAPTKPPAPAAPKAPPLPSPAPMAAVPPRPVAPPMPAAVVADRARAAAIMEAAPPGAEAERDEGIRTGASVEEFRRSLGAFTILNAMRAARG